MKRIALLRALIEGGLAHDAEDAQRLIDKRCVTVNGAIALSGDRQVAPHDNLLVRVQPTYVSRGGEKLAHALDHFGISVDGRDALDVGASTGGFTDCLLQRGARSVVALDAGRNLLHEHLLGDSRVHVRDGVNIRTIERPIDGAPFAVMVVDVSFISLRAIAGVLAGLVSADSDVIALVKPQFECTKIEADQAGGVIRDPHIHDRVLREVQESFVAVGVQTIGVVRSPITGHEGNVEFLLHARLA